jgi:para-aminobenzoate synthetase component 1
MPFDSTICFLNSNDGTGLLAFGEKSRFLPSKSPALDELQDYINQKLGTYLFGYLSYDLKDEVETLSSNNFDGLSFPTLFFWEPEYIIEIKENKYTFIQGEQSLENTALINEFLSSESKAKSNSFDFKFKERTSKERYLEQVISLKNSIQRGDIYEVNYCQEYFAENVKIEYPIAVYNKLNSLTKAPFSSYFHFDNYSLFCGSPERYIKLNNKRLISEPIKGTAPRSKDPIQDLRNKENLETDPKERAENIMIVDLVRNDFSKIAANHSVKVDALCAVHSFENVHQMISTVSCEITEGTTFTDIIKASFPMGSMTGAPKLKAMELIEESEDFKRGLYSGSLGYINPNGDFDFNVIIRSLLYNQDQQYLSCSVGGAITIQSDPEKEYAECLTKVNRILTGMHE